MFTENPSVNKEDFLAKVDGLIAALERLHGSVPALPAHAFVPLPAAHLQPALRQ